jgi:hypothetical protein
VRCRLAHVAGTGGAIAMAPLALPHAVRWASGGVVRAIVNDILFNEQPSLELPGQPDVTSTLPADFPASLRRIDLPGVCVAGFTCGGLVLINMLSEGLRNPLAVVQAAARVCALCALQGDWAVQLEAAFVESADEPFGGDGLACELRHAILRPPSSLPLRRR